MAGSIRRHRIRGQTDSGPEVRYGVDRRTERCEDIRQPEAGVEMLGIPRHDPAVGIARLIESLHRRASTRARLYSAA